MPKGTCRLCRKEARLMKSHMMPAALYGDRKKDYELTTLNGTTKTKVQMKYSPCSALTANSGSTGMGKRNVSRSAIALKNRKAFPFG